MPYAYFPVATYRLQLNSEFPLPAVSAIVPYLARLGISTLYLSPILQPRSGSMHGYDVCDPTSVNAEIGGEEAFQELVAVAQRHGIGTMLDMVPNHMAAHPENPWWRRVLAEGVDAPEADFFDIDWRPARQSLTGKVLIPILGRPYVEALEAGEFEIEHGEAESWLLYYDWRLPLSSAAESTRRLQRLLAARDADAPEREQLELLDQLLEAQHYRLADWHSTSSEINYRRFFDISDLVGLNQQLDVVFEATHQLYLELARVGMIAGLRIDHIDGLRDPHGYLQQLQDRFSADPERPFYVVVEKILEAQYEELPGDWPVAGTTGYDALAVMTGVLANSSGAPTLERLYQDLTGDKRSFTDLVYEQKLRMIETLFAADFERLEPLLVTVADYFPAGRDIIRHDLLATLVQLTAAMPVYRTYIDERGASDADREMIDRSVDAVLERRPDLERAATMMRRILLGEALVDEAIQTVRTDLIARWQQISGAVMAKGLEDTSLYIDTRLVSLNTVGGNPTIIDIGREHLHNWAKHCAVHWPGSLTATSTHDTKRSEDVRARINVLSEIAEEWASRFQRWWEMTAPARRKVDGEPVPDGRAGLLFFQTLLGIWPLGELDLKELRERLHTYMTKAEREAKQRTSWHDVNESYEDALLAFIDEVVDPSAWPELFDDFLQFEARIARLGAYTSLSQVMLKLTLPGVPDFYQGTEIWNLSLVDPDNRRPVDYELRQGLLDQLEAEQPSLDVLLDRWQTGEVKLDFIRRLLAVRHREPDLFSGGDYQALDVAGPRERHIIAFARSSETRWAIVIVPRFFAAIEGMDPAGWQGTTIEIPAQWSGRATNVLTGETVVLDRGRLDLSVIGGRYPWACLIPEVS